MCWICAVATTRPGRTGLMKLADRLIVAMRASSGRREQMDAAHGVEQHQGDAAMRDAVLAEVPLLDLELDVGAVRGRDPAAVAEQALERAGRGPLGLAPELADELVDCFLLCRPRAGTGPLTNPAPAVLASPGESRRGALHARAAG